MSDIVELVCIIELVMMSLVAMKVQALYQMELNS